MNESSKNMVFFLWLMVLRWSQSTISLRFGITWKLACLFGHCYKFSPTPSLQLPSIQLSDRRSNRHFDMWATLYGIYHPENILVRLKSEPVPCVLHFNVSFLCHLSVTNGGYQSRSICCRCVPTQTQKLHGLKVMLIVSWSIPIFSVDSS